MSPSLPPPPFNRTELRQLVAEFSHLRLALEQQSFNWSGWLLLLHPYDQQEGEAGPQPYTPKAIAAFETAYGHNEEDSRAIHHLAIAYHALAWDLELEGSPQAMANWEKSFFYWNRLKNNGAFWADLVAWGKANLGDTFDPQVVHDFRQNLIAYLLQIHVSFIRYYYEQQLFDQVDQHIRLIRHARISPAARLEFEDQIYHAMTGPVTRAVASGDYQTALDLLERFLALIPRYGPALIRSLEISALWLEQLLPVEEWATILDLERRAVPIWETLDDVIRSLDHLPQTCADGPLMLNDSAYRLGEKYYLKGQDLTGQGEQAGTDHLTDEVYQIYHRVIFWLKRVDFSRPGQSKAGVYLINALIACFNYLVSLVNAGSSTFPITSLDDLLADCRAAGRLIPEDVFSHDSNPLNQLMEQGFILRAEYKVALAVEVIMHPTGQFDIDQLLDEAEQDCQSVLALNPDSPNLQALIERIRQIRQYR
jgi:tetratricopeptide (TPR) repeat protein